MITVEECLNQKYPLFYACEKGASLNVVKYLVEEADGDKGKEPLGKADKDGDYPLHLACKNGASLDVIKYLVEEVDDDKGKELLGKAINYDKYRGALPLHIAIDRDASVEVIRVLLEADSSAAEKTVRLSDGDMLPLHLAIDKRRSLDVVKALVKAYPEGAKPLLRKDGLSDDVVLAILKVYPDAAKEDISMPPLHLAITNNRSDEVVEALLDAYPGATERVNLDTNHLPLHDAIQMNRSEGILLLLVNAYPQAAKKKMNDGWLPIEYCASYGQASEDLMLELLKADMPLRIEDGTPAEHGGSWTACVTYNTDNAAGAVRRILSMSEGGGGFGVHIHALADVRDAEGRTALGIASSGPRAAISRRRKKCV